MCADSCATMLLLPRRARRKQKLALIIGGHYCTTTTFPCLSSPLLLQPYKNIPPPHLTEVAHLTLTQPHLLQTQPPTTTPPTPTLSDGGVLLLQAVLHGQGEHNPDQPAHHIAYCGECATQNRPPYFAGGEELWNGQRHPLWQVVDGERDRNRQSGVTHHGKNTW